MLELDVLVSDFLAADDLSEYADIGLPITSSVRFVQFVEDRVSENFVIQWSGRINSEIGPSGRGRNKLRIRNFAGSPQKLLHINIPTKT